MSFLCFYSLCILVFEVEISPFFPDTDETAKEQSSVGRSHLFTCVPLNLFFSKPTSKLGLQVVLLILKILAFLMLASILRMPNVIAQM